MNELNFSGQPQTGFLATDIAAALRSQLPSFHRPSRRICLPINQHYSLVEGSRPGWESYINILALAYMTCTSGL